MNKIEFTEQNIQRIKELYSSGIGSTTIAKEFNVSWATINRIIDEQEWERLRDKSYIGQKFNKLTIEDQVKKPGFKRTIAICRCECGNKTSSSLSKVILGIKKSCGCYRRTKEGREKYGSFRRKEYGVSALNALFGNYKSNSKRKNISFDLTLEEAKFIFKGNCFYCGKEPSNIKKLKTGYGEFVYNGIDRKDNTKGYSMYNCVPCCSFCNYTKNSVSFNEFIKWIRTVCKNTESVKCE